VLWIDRFSLLASDLSHRNNPLHPANVRQLRRAENNVADRIDSWLRRLHPAIGLNEAAVGLNPGGFATHVFLWGFAAHSDENFFGFKLLLLAIHANGACNA